MKEYLLLAAFMIPSLVVLGAALVTVSHADDPAARELVISNPPCGDPALVMRKPEGLWEELVRRSQRAANTI